MRGRIISSRFWTVVAFIGVDDFLSRIYWALKLRLRQYSCPQTVAGVTATFATATRAEYLRTQRLTGEKPVLEAFIACLEPDDVVYDVGANTGLFACFASRALESGSVIGFEPEPAHKRRAEENLAKNAGKATTTVLPIALYDTDGETELEVCGGLGEGTHHLDADDAGTTVTVSTRRAETMIESEGIPVPDVVKIDVEGAELNVLDGFGPFLSDIRVVICEIHRDKVTAFGATNAMVESRLERAGFDLEQIFVRGQDYHVLASKHGAST